MIAAHLARSLHALEHVEALVEALKQGVGVPAKINVLCDVLPAEERAHFLARIDALCDALVERDLAGLLLSETGELPNDDHVQQLTRTRAQRLRVARWRAGRASLVETPAHLGAPDKSGLVAHLEGLLVEADPPLR